MGDPAAGFAPFDARLPPQNIEAEQGVLGSVLQDWDVMGDVVTVVEPGQFYRDTHRVIFGELREVYKSGGPCDALILADRLARADDGRGGKLLDYVGGAEAIADIQNAVPHSANAVYYAEIVRQKAMARDVIECCNRTLKAAYSNDLTGEDLFESAERDMFALSDRRAAGTTVRAGALIDEFHALTDRRQSGEVSGLTTGFLDVDDVACGLQPGNLIYLAGRTSMGKTAFALNFIEHQVLQCRRPVLLSSLEMSRGEVVERLAVARARLDGKKVRTGNLDGGERTKLRRAADDFRESPLFIDGTPSQNMVHIAANARRHKAREGIQGLVVDLVNHIGGDDPRASRREQIGDISRRLKALARELAIPVLVLAQFNRGPESREADGHRPRVSDLKDCGNLEEDADLILMIHRPDYYDPGNEPGIAYVIIGKNRNGPTGDVKCTFLKHCARFDNYYPDVSNF